MNMQGDTYLMEVAQAYKLSALKFLLDETPLGRPGADGVDAVNEGGATALFKACWWNHGACVRYIITAWQRKG